MSWSRSVSCLLASATLGLFACHRAPRLQVLGESTRLPRDEPSPPDSCVYDGKVVRLRGARGETLGLPPGIRLVASEVTDERVRIVVRSERDTEADALLSHRKLLQDGSVEVLLRWIGSVATVRSPGRDGA